MDPNPVNHVLHLLATVFLCGFWLPIWILMALTAPTRYLRCLSCGQIPGTATPEDMKKAAERREKLAAQVRQASGERAERRRQAVDEATTAATEAAAVAAKATAQGAGAVLNVALVGAKETFRQIDRVTLAAAGGDVFMAWFFRFFLALGMLIVGGLVLYVAASVIG
ncbi:MAG TPA: hypothetical protein VM165_23730 [Planctomycetaceae bacterium]|nr:hypothetical protein [Planctomycetaceae bacterium]